MRSLSGIFITTALLAFITVSGFSQNTLPAGDQKKESSQVTTPGTFTDKNNNGICDNFEAVDGRGRGPGFIDKDGDGVCDHRQNVTPGKGYPDCPGKGKGYGHRHGWKKGYGCGRGYQHRHGWQNQDVSPAKDQPSEIKKD